MKQTLSAKDAVLRERIKALIRSADKLDLDGVTKTFLHEGWINDLHKALIDTQTEQAECSVPEAPDDALVGLALRGWKVKMGYSDIERMREALTDVFFYLRGGE